MDSLAKIRCGNRIKQEVVYGETVWEGLLEFARSGEEGTPGLGFRPMVEMWLFNTDIRHAFAKVWAPRLRCPLERCYVDHGPGRSMDLMDNLKRV